MSVVSVRFRLPPFITSYNRINYSGGVILLRVVFFERRVFPRPTRIVRYDIPPEGDGREKFPGRRRLRPAVVP